MDQLLELLKGVRADLDFTQEERLIDGKVLDSFDIVSIIGGINDTFDISIDCSDLVPENMNSAKAMWAMISRYKNK